MPVVGHTEGAHDELPFREVCMTFSIRPPIAFALAAGAALLGLILPSIGDAAFPNAVHYDGGASPKPWMLQQRYHRGRDDYLVKVRLDGARAVATVTCGGKVLAKAEPLEGLGLEGHKLVGLDLQTDNDACGQTFSLRTFLIPDKFEETPPTVVHRFDFSGGKLY